MMERHYLGKNVSITFSAITANLSFTLNSLYLTQVVECGCVGDDGRRGPKCGWAARAEIIPGRRRRRSGEAFEEEPRLQTRQAQVHVMLQVIVLSGK